jgi:hypothetical protein
MAELEFYAQQLAAHKAQQCIAREQLAAMEEAAQHEEDYKQKEADEVCTCCQSSSSACAIALLQCSTCTQQRNLHASPDITHTS